MTQTRLGWSSGRDRTLARSASGKRGGVPANERACLLLSGSFVNRRSSSLEGGLPPPVPTALASDSAHIPGATDSICG
jgi:hypothetical protein